MTDTPDVVEITPEIEKKAKDLMRKRFKFVKKPGATLKALAKLGLERVCQDMAVHPERYTEAKKSKVERSGADPVDPYSMLAQEMQLPSLPQVFMELQDAINSPDKSASDLAKIISQDPGISAFLLRMVNSAFYSLPSQVDTISRAVTVIGVDQLSTLAVGTSVMSLFQDIPEGMIDMERFWMHSIACGIVAKKLCNVTKKGNAERAFVAGLLHDIGQLVMFRAVPERAKEAVMVAHAEGLLVSDAEKDVIGIDHATLGGMIMRKWNFPFVLVSAVLEHHKPKEEHKEFEPELIHCAEVITAGLGIGSGGEYFVQPPVQVVWDRIVPDTKVLEKVVDGLDEELEEAFAILLDK